ncbi:MAG TPA: DUF6519 domain-containing protein [Albitalea sp.]|nr:DUF6519 domain-containing protein [Albitalea sp.]
MKGDFSRISFDATRHFSRVLLQQGRVTLDADPNEEGAILLHYLRTLARDLIGPCGGPPDHLGFELTLDTSDSSHPKLTIGKGRYYVDGILVENDSDCDYATQPDWSAGSNDPLLLRLKAGSGQDFWLYLDVWERHVTWIEDDRIRESALGGPDTCTRAKVVWQVRAVARDALVDTLTARRDAIQVRLDNDQSLTDDERATLQAQHDKLQQDIDRLAQTTGTNARNDCTAPLDALVGLSDAQMTARLDPGQQIKDPCTVSPDALYRGAENQLYRVEVHRGSAAGVAPTFKWSRDNGSVATRWLGTEGNDLVVTSGRDFSAGCWVELGDDSNDLLGEPGLLVKLAKVDGDRLSVDPASIPSGASIAFTTSLRHAKVRRWDQRETDDTTLDEGAVPLVEASATEPNWLTLEDGIQVQFAAGGSYRSGDYWLIPARVATGSIEWPSTLDASGTVQWQPQPPRGVEHHYAPLGYVAVNSDGNLDTTRCLCEIEPINTCDAQRRIDRGQPPAPRPARPKTTGGKPK